MASDQNFKRRQYSAQRKSQVVGECEVPGASVARVAMAHGINVNIVHSWRQIARTSLRSTGTSLMPTPTHFGEARVREDMVRGREGQVLIIEFLWRALVVCRAVSFTLQACRRHIAPSLPSEFRSEVPTLAGTSLLHRKKPICQINLLGYKSTWRSPPHTASCQS
jgi:transposase